MNKIIVYWGPKKGFSEYIKDLAEITTLAEAVNVSDAKRKQFTLKSADDEENIQIVQPHYSNLVAFSESYSSITEGAVQSFLTLLNEFDVENLFLQNPPRYIKEQIEQSFPNIVEYKTYTYKSVTRSMFLKIANTFDDNIIGQAEAKERLLISLYPLMKSKKAKPSVIMMYGVSGVGKTETAKFISSVLGQQLFRKQFSMFHSEEFSTYIFGGKHVQSCLARDLLERESNVILMDEFDKPAPVFHSAFYQLFDEGTFEDKNYSVDLSNAIIFCTSNYQSEEDIRKNLGDPIFYRFDKFIKFNRLSETSIKKVIEKMFSEKCVKYQKEKFLDMELIKQLFLNNASKFQNVRHLNNIVEEYIDMELVRNFLKQEDKPNE